MVSGAYAGGGSMPSIPKGEGHALVGTLNTSDVPKKPRFQDLGSKRSLECRASSRLQLALQFEAILEGEKIMKKKLLEAGRPPEH